MRLLYQLSQRQLQLETSLESLTSYRFDRMVQKTNVLQLSPSMLK